MRKLKRFAGLLLFLGVLAIALWLEHVFWRGSREETVVDQSSWLYSLFLDDHGPGKAPGEDYFIRRRYEGLVVLWAVPSFGVFCLLSGMGLLLRDERRATRP